MQSKKEIRKQKLLMIEAWKQSGLSQKDWCIRKSVTYHSFHYWYKRYRVAQSIATGSSTKVVPDKNNEFISLQVQSSFQHQTSAWLELLLTDGRRLLFHSPVSSDYLKAIIS